MIAIGWLGWSEEQALASDVNAIMVGYEGRCDMLRSIFGGGEERPPPPLPVMTPSVLKAMFSK
ncbi:hypothetical protein [Mesorhizobium sp. M7A.F.Ca.ET.027.03.2.1]|uniref:hypothetical protein n=1 Tax=Mesorhizobium sp. M7A.F.Ca.ET.027.03.2.1 TaxID=2496656 RepID=UPI000FCA8D62|nr:hypothetical protein [Mesorhizobium sp. M7A.F.Ca.ET.027.03.2.1]RVD66407.1 hypothetical protein EN750_03590 [Mesorhizobium sp. M7A.F.Ca.ET.027.03.2.1]